MPATHSEVLFNFVVCVDDRNRDELLRITDIDELVTHDPQMAAMIAASGQYCWILQTYINLVNRQKLRVACSNDIDGDAINIIHSSPLLFRNDDHTTFTVCVRADYPKRRWSHYHLVQNMAQLGRYTSFIPHWTQPGLRKRDSLRTDVTRVAYAGQVHANLADDVPAWKAMFAPHAIEFVSLESNEWHDLSAIDVLVGVRSFDMRTYDSKPASKLVNAWLAEIPFIGGNDSAFKQIGVPGEDYLLATSAADVVAAVVRLKNDRQLYDRLVQNGIDKAKLYSKDLIAEKWETVLTGPVLTRYRAWQEMPQREKLRYNITRMIDHNVNAVKRTVKNLIKY